MGGSAFDKGWESRMSSNGVRNLVLVGKTGHGKSSTANSILGRRAFKSKSSSAGVTTTSELHSTVLEDGKKINVIDTPGLFDFSADPEFVGKEIVKCIEMAKDGIHAVLVVLTVRARFSREEEACIQSLNNIFGGKITDYVIVVFTGGDDLERDDETLEDYLGRDCPEPLKEILKMCENRYVLFDNATKDESKNSEQLRQLFFLVNQVMYRNGGNPFTNELFVELKREAMKLQEETAKLNASTGYTKEEVSELIEQFQKSYEDQIKRTTEMVESKLKETMDQLKEQLTEERAARAQAEAARAQAEAAMQVSQMKSDYERRTLREDLDRAQRETERLQRRPEAQLPQALLPQALLPQVQLPPIQCSIM